MLTEALVAEARTQGIERLVVGAIVHDQGRALVVTRSASDDFLPGIDELPSGGVEPGETLTNALDRELYEEVGFTAGSVDPGFLSTFDYRSGSGRNTRQFTVSIALGPREIRLSAEHSAFRWVVRADLGLTTTTPETRRVLTDWFDWDDCEKAAAR